MVDLGTSGTLDKGANLGNYQNPCDQTLDEASGCFDGNPKGLNVGNVGDSSRVVVDLEKGLQFIETIAEEKQTNVGFIGERRKLVNENKEIVMEEGKKDLGQKIQVSGNISLFVDLCGPLNGIIRRDETNPRENLVGGAISGGVSTEEKTRGIRSEETVADQLAGYSGTNEGHSLDLYGHQQFAIRHHRGTAETKGDDRTFAETGLLSNGFGNNATFSVQSGSSVGVALEKTDVGSAKLSGAGSDVLGKCGSGAAENKMASIERNKSPSSAAAVVTSSRKHASKVSKLGNGGAEIGVKTEKGNESRERKKSRYLSPPYINLKEGRKNSPISEHETDNSKESSRGAVAKSVNAGQSVAKHTRSKPKKKESKKAVSGPNTFGKLAIVNASSGELLSELRFAALDCLYPKENKDFNSVEGFFSGFRGWVFNTEPYQEMCKKNTNGQVSQGKGKGKGKGKEAKDGNVKNKETKSAAAGVQNVNKNADSHGSIGEGSQEINELIANVLGKRKRSKKEEGAIAICTTNSIPGIVDTNGKVAASGSIVFDFEEGCLLTPEGKPLQKKRKKNEGPNSELPPTKETADMPDLNGSSTTPSVMVFDSQVKSPAAVSKDEPGPKKRKKRKDEVKLADSSPNIIPSVVDFEAMTAKLISFQLGSNVENVPVVGASSLDGVSELISKDGIKEAYTLGLKPEHKASQLDVMGEKAGNNSCLGKDIELMNLLVSGGKREPKKRKRKETAAPSESPLPDLNGNGAEPNSAEKDSAVAGKTARKRVTKAEAIMPDLNVNLHKLRANGDVSGTALLMKFAPECPVPTKEALAEIFGVFGPLNELEMQIVDDPTVTQVVFTSSSDARDAFCSLAKSNPFGAALVNYRHVNLSDELKASESESNSHVSTALRLTEGLTPPIMPSDPKPNIKPLVEPSGLIHNINLPNIKRLIEPSGQNPNVNPAVEPPKPNTKPPAKPRAKPPGVKPKIKSPLMPPGFKPNVASPAKSQPPDLFFIRQNLEMMTSMLEKAGDDLAPETRANLENEIKGLMKTISTMVGGSSSSPS